MGVVGQIPVTEAIWSFFFSFNAICIPQITMTLDILSFFVSASVSPHFLFECLYILFFQIVSYFYQMMIQFHIISIYLLCLYPFFTITLPQIAVLVIQAFLRCRDALEEETDLFIEHKPMPMNSINTKVKKYSLLVHKFNPMILYIVLSYSHLHLYTSLEML